MMEKRQYNNIIRYGVAAVAVTALCVPIVCRTDAMPSVSDVWGCRAVMVLAVLAFAIVCLNRRLPRWHWADGVVLLWWVSVSLNYLFVSPYPAEEAYGEVTALGVAYVSLRLIVPYCGKRFSRLWFAGLCVAGGYEIGLGLMQLVGREASRHHLFAVTGTFFNPGPYAVFLAVVCAVSGAWWYRHRAETTVDSWFCRCKLGSVAAVALFCFPVLMAAWSRTAWLAVAVAAGCLLWRSHRRMVFVGTAVAVCAGLAVYFLKQGSADGRLLMAAVAGRACAGEWLTGYGLGGYVHAYGEAQEAFFALHPDSPLSAVAGSPEYAFNGLLGVGVEQGLLGVLPALLLGLWSLGMLLRHGEVSAYGWLALLVSSLFSYPFALFPFLLIAVVWVALAVSLGAGTADRRWWTRAVMLPVVGTCVWLVWTLSVHTARRVAVYEEFHRVRGIQDIAFLDDYRKKYEDLKAYPDFLFTFGKTLREAGCYNESNAVLSQGAQVSCDPVFYTLTGNNYRDLGAVKEAEAAYRKAFGMLPGRMYPLYCLMKLYEAEGQTDKAENIARRIVAFKPKVDSPAMREMKAEAKKLTNR